MMKALLIYLLLLSASPPAPVSISVTPRLGQSPLSVRVRVTVPQNEDNRVLCFGYDGPKSQESCEDHDGNAPMTTWQVFQELPEGYYTFYAIIGRKDGSQKQAVTSVCSAGPEVSCGFDNDN